MGVGPRKLAIDEADKNSTGTKTVKGQHVEAKPVLGETVGCQVSKGTIRQPLIGETASDTSRPKGDRDRLGRLGVT